MKKTEYLGHTRFKGQLIWGASTHHTTALSDCTLIVGSKNAVLSLSSGELRPRPL